MKEMFGIFGICVKGKFLLDFGSDVLIYVYCIIIFDRFIGYVLEWYVS